VVVVNATIIVVFMIVPAYSLENEKHQRRDKYAPRPDKRKHKTEYGSMLIRGGRHTSNIGPLTSELNLSRRAHLPNLPNLVQNFGR
jgi:hypothetical protein